MNKSSVRRALTTLKKNGLISVTPMWLDLGVLEIKLTIPAELTHPKKRTLKTKKVLKIKQVTSPTDILSEPAGDRRIIEIGQETSLESWVEKQHITISKDMDETVKLMYKMITPNKNKLI